MKMTTAQRLQLKMVTLHLARFTERARSHGKPDEAVAALLTAQAELNRLVEQLVPQEPANTTGGPISGSRA